MSATPMRAIVLCVAVSWVCFPQTPVADIRVNQAGYLPHAPKVAIVAAAQPAKRFQVIDRDSGRVVFRGELSPPSADADSGDTLKVADFSRVTRPGSYALEVPNVGRSWSFRIAADVYSRPLYLAMRSFYGQRCGTAVEMGPEFPGYKYEACHLIGAYHPSSGKAGERSSHKGWHDAGDYGRYVVNSSIATGTMLWAFEMFQPVLSKLNLHIPESANATPDVLDEIRWNLDWMRTMQDTDGGVWHKQTSERFAGFVMPHQDKLTSYVIGTGSEPYKNSCATAGFATVMAIASRVFRPYDPAFTRDTAEAARSAWNWLDAHSQVLFDNPKGVATGAYGDRDCSDERLWAAAELWRTTRDETYHRYFLANHAAHLKAIRPVGPPSWNAVGPLGLWTYVLGKGADAAAVQQITKDTVTAAEEIRRRSAANGYRISLTSTDYIWGSNAVAANYAMHLLIAHAFTRDRGYVNTALDNLHYLLGRNTFSLSFLTAVGQNSFQHPHHRPSGADANKEPWPGLLSGGPNRRKQDPAMQKLPDGLPPARMYIDDQGSYAANEIAINWNAPLVFLLAAASSVP